MTPRGTYPGGKAGEGVTQALINQIPPHSTLLVPFAGRCAVTCAIRPAQATWLVDADPKVAEWWRSRIASFDDDRSAASTIVKTGDGIRFLAESGVRGSGVFVFCDPPYLNCTSDQPYAHKLDAAGHGRLLDVLRALSSRGCRIMLCGYPSDLYARELRGWRTMEVNSPTRAGWRAETVWMNYPVPLELHDYRYLGSDFRERERIKRLRQRARAKLQRRTPQERYAILAELELMREEEAAALAAAMRAGVGP